MRGKTQRNTVLVNQSRRHLVVQHKYRKYSVSHAPLTRTRGQCRRTLRHRLVLAHQPCRAHQLDARPQSSMGLSSRVTPRGESCGGVAGTLLPPTNLAPVRGKLSRFSGVATPSPSVDLFESVPFTVSAPSLPGTSRLDRLTPPTVLMLGRLLLCRSAADVGLVWIGNLVSGPPALRSRRCPRGLAGLVARPRLALAFSSRALFRSSIRALRLLSSVLIARGRLLLTDDE